MTKPMTPQERAAAIYGSLNAYVPYERCVSDKEFEQVEIDRREDIDDIVYLIQQTRRAALLEAAQVAEKCKNQSALGRVRDAYSYVEANLRKLAQEG